MTFKPTEAVQRALERAHVTAIDREFISIVSHEWGAWEADRVWDSLWSIEIAKAKERRK